MSVSRRSFAVLFALVAIVPSAFAATATSTFQVLVDADRSAATGCAVSADGKRFEGAEQIITTTVEASETAARVLNVVRQVCSDPAAGTFAAPFSVFAVPNH